MPRKLTKNQRRLLQYFDTKDEAKLKKTTGKPLVKKGWLEIVRCYQPRLGPHGRYYEGSGGCLFRITALGRAARVSGFGRLR